MRRCRHINSRGGPALVGKVVLNGNPTGSEKDKKRHEEARREIMILSKIRHQHIAELVDLVVQGGMVLFVMQYEPGGDLHHFLSQTTKRGLFEHEAVHTFRQLLEAVRFLHSWEIIHRDIKDRNILVSSCEWDGEQCTPHVKVTDFGLSKMRDDEASTTSLHQLVGTLCFMAPEVYRRQYDDQGFAVDYFSLGIVLCYMMTLRYPGDGFERNRRGEAIPCPCSSSQQSLDEHIQRGLPTPLHGVALGQLRLDPYERASMGPVQALAALDEVYPSPSVVYAPSSSSGLGPIEVCCCCCPVHQPAAPGSAMPRLSKRSREDLETEESPLAQALQENENLRQANAAKTAESQQLRQQLVDADSAIAQVLQNQEIQEADEAYARELDRENERREVARQGASNGCEFVDIAFNAACVLNSTMRRLFHAEVHERRTRRRTR